MASIADHSGPRPRPADRRQPTRLGLALFGAKVALFCARRTLAEFGRAPKRLRRAGDPAVYDHLLVESVTSLWSDASLAERAMQLGKVHNLRRAAMAFDGLELPAAAVLSFWRQLGKASRSRGFADGRMLQEGCMIPAVGGGLCQLSNALYDVALRAGCEIVERHAHSRMVPGSAAAWGRDATVAWNYVDLRFASARPLRLSVRLDEERLVVSLFARSSDPAPTSEPSERGALVDPRAAAESCGSCDQTDCALHESSRPPPALPTGRAAFLVDEAWPELLAHVTGERRDGDLLCLPRRDAWANATFADIVTAPCQALARSLAWRTTPSQGPTRRRAEASTSAAIARALGTRLGPEVTEVTVAQSLLPDLWRDGWLGGRRFSVLMTRLPTDLLQARLDAAFARHPDRVTLADYRALEWLIAAETAALARAETIVTPHAEIAALFPGRVRLLDWRRPSVPATPPRRGDVIAFPGATVARKGAYELRDAALSLGLTIRPLGAELEGPDFWRGVALDAPASPAEWLDGVAAVVAPALVESAPRRLLAALAAGVPVIATEACGLAPQPGFHLVPADDVDALAAAIEAVLRARRTQSSAMATVNG